MCQHPQPVPMQGQGSVCSCGFAGAAKAESAFATQQSWVCLCSLLLDTRRVWHVAMWSCCVPCMARGGGGGTTRRLLSAFPCPYIAAAVFLGSCQVPLGAGNREFASPVMYSSCGQHGRRCEGESLRSAMGAAGKLLVPLGYFCQQEVNVFEGGYAYRNEIMVMTHHTFCETEDSKKVKVCCCTGTSQCTALASYQWTFL